MAKADDIIQGGVQLRTCDVAPTYTSVTVKDKEDKGREGERGR